jgi:hypothetical protein
MTRHRIPASGLFLVLLALATQLALGAMVPRSMFAVTAEVTPPICHAGGIPGDAPAAPHAPADCLMCPLCVSLVASAFTLPVAQVLAPDREIIVARAAIPPPSRAPPGAVALAAQPRGPPCLI